MDECNTLKKNKNYSLTYLTKFIIITIDDISWTLNNMIAQSLLIIINWEILRIYEHKLEGGVCPLP